MTIDSVGDITPRVQYVASASQVDFDYGFPIFENADLDVYVNGALVALSTDYTVTGAGNDTGGTITFIVPMVGNEIVTIARDIPIERISQFASDGPQPSDSFNEEFNRITAVEQQLADLIGRSIRVKVFSTVTDAQLELDLSTFASKYLGFDANGVPVALDNTSGIMTVPAGSVTLAKLADLAAHTIMGNNTGSSAAPLALTVAQVKTLLALVVADITGAAPLASPTLTGTPLAPTAAPGTNTTQIATTAYATAADVVVAAAAAAALAAAIAAIAPVTSTTGAAPYYGARAWVAWTSAGSIGSTPAISAQGNVASVTNLGSGLIRVTFTTAMADTNYAVVVGSATGTLWSTTHDLDDKQTGHVDIHFTTANDATNQNFCPTSASVVVFR